MVSPEHGHERKSLYYPQLFIQIVSFIYPLKLLCNLLRAYIVCLYFAYCKTNFELKLQILKLLLMKLVLVWETTKGTGQSLA